MDTPEISAQPAEPDAPDSAAVGEERPTPPKDDFLLFLLGFSVGQFLAATLHPAVLQLIVDELKTMEGADV